MFSFINKSRSCAVIRVTGTDAEEFLDTFFVSGGELFEVRSVGRYELEIIVKEEDMDLAERAALRSGCGICVIKKRGAKRWREILLRRICPSIVAAVLISALFISKFYVWEITVSGNESVPSGEILDVLSECGVRSGAFWPDFSPDNIRSQILYSIPELSWATVNMRGSLAEVIVVERSEVPEMEYNGEPADIVAERAGFIRTVNTLVGQTEVRSGEVVEKGDVLISGIAESSWSPPRMLRAQGGVTAEINGEYNAVAMAEKHERIEKGGVSRKFAIIIGNKRINFYSGSSISEGFCDKIISVWKAEADDLFSLPVTLICISQYEYESEKVFPDKHEQEKALELSLMQYFERDLSGAEGLNEKFTYSASDGLVSGTLRVRCIAEIGKTVPISAERIADAENNYNSKVDE